VRTSWLPAIHAACVVLLFAVALRWAWFGDPIAGRMSNLPARGGSAQILRETLARAPVAILTVGGRAATPNDRILAAELARRYRLAATRSIRLYGTQREPAQLWLRR
jgi:hypothetical protein